MSNYKATPIGSVIVVNPDAQPQYTTVTQNTTMNINAVFNEEVTQILKRVNDAQEILGMGGKDCVYNAGQQLELASHALRELIDSTKEY